jgi:hypothetical protein
MRVVVVGCVCLKTNKACLLQRHRPPVHCTTACRTTKRVKAVRRPVLPPQCKRKKNKKLPVCRKAAAKVKLFNWCRASAANMKRPKCKQFRPPRPPRSPPPPPRLRPPPPPPRPPPPSPPPPPNPPPPPPAERALLCAASNIRKGKMVSGRRTTASRLGCSSTAATPAACCERCTEQASCRGWTLAQVDCTWAGLGESVGACYLFDEVTSSYDSWDTAASYTAAWI